MSSGRFTVILFALGAVAPGRIDTVIVPGRPPYEHSDPPRDGIAFDSTHDYPTPRPRAFLREPGEELRTIG